MRDKICELVRDLLPLYIEGDLSPESSEIVKEHLEECADCRSLYDRMEKPMELQTPAEQITAPINRIKKNAVLKILKGFGILLLVIAVAVAVAAVIFARPLFNGFEPVNQANISIEMEDGRPVLIMDEKAQEGRLTLIHRTNKDGTITMYISFGDFKSQYLFAMRTDEYYRGELFYIPFRYVQYDDMNGEIDGGIRTKDGSAGSSCLVFKPLRIILPEQVKKIYYLPDISMSQTESWRRSVYYKQLTEAEKQDNALISTDGFDFSSLDEVKLIWQKE
ncbi:MAG: zf-HC2 domain-containing protein [Eubacterium sp.]|nr:zf-HC2 domain-containing protein [Eubacterium sp.]